ncbi:Protein FRIGIDA [Acorus calamus]|uniref:FRIGIDA-like protein n=1 Tax=Acorus calamus TaxID=4465 RepID=A0AAV9BZA4_ACOCL|nr:Protein FRIGIDA [Acorus calamus]
MEKLYVGGGLAHTVPNDARGLLLLIASFGIPSDFTSNDICFLLHAGHLKLGKEATDAIRLSPFLLERIPEVIRDMLNNEKQIAAVDLACSFGLEDKFPPVALLQSFLRNNKETMMQMRREAHGSIAALKVVNQKSLSAIKAVLKCLEDDKLDGTELSNFNMAAQVATLTKLIKIEDEKLRERTMRRRTKKRDAHQLGSSRKPFTPKKRPRSGAADGSYAQTPVNAPPQNSGSALSDGMNFYKHPQSSAANASYGQPPPVNVLPQPENVLSGGMNMDGMNMYNGSHPGNFYSGGFPGLVAGNGAGPLYAGSGAVPYSGNVVAPLPNNSSQLYMQHGSNAPVDGLVEQVSYGLSYSMGRSIVHPSLPADGGSTDTPPSIGNWSSGPQPYGNPGMINPMAPAAPGHQPPYLC